MSYLSFLLIRTYTSVNYNILIILLIFKYFPLTDYDYIPRKLVIYYNTLLYSQKSHLTDPAKYCNPT